jgi:hypothetical protein
MDSQGIGALGNLQAQMGGSQLPGQNTAVTKVIMHYFKNRGVPLDKGLAAVQKELAEGLKLTAHGQSVMGLKMLGQGVAKVHFFTMGTEQQLDEDIQFFAAQLQQMGIRTIYDTELDPMSAKGLQMAGYQPQQSDQQQYKFKATI